MYMDVLQQQLKTDMPTRQTQHLQHSMAASPLAPSFLTDGPLPWTYCTVSIRSIRRRSCSLFSLHFFDRPGTTIEFHLFGDVGFLTFDPNNLESILATNFEGTFC